MLPAASEVEFQFNDGAGMTANEHVRRRARRPSWPPRTRLELRQEASRSSAEVDLVRCPRREHLVRPIAVVPLSEDREFALDCSEPERDQDSSRALGLHGPDEALDDRDAAVVPDGAEALTSAAAATPSTEPDGCELSALVGDEVSWCDSGLAGDAIEKPLYRRRRGLAAESDHAHHAPGVVVDHDGNPPAEWPALGECPREPRHPEAADDRYGREVGVPDVVWPLCPNDRSGLRNDSLRPSSCVRVGEHPANGGRPEVESGSAEDPGDPPSPHGRAERLQPADDVPDELGESVHGLREPHQGLRSLVVEPVHPRGDGQRRHEQASSGFGERPGPRRSELEDCQPVDGRVVGPALGWDTLHSGILDPQFFSENGDLAPESVVLGLEPDPSVEVVFGLTSGDGEDYVGQRDGVDCSGADAAGPTLRKRDVVFGVLGAHRSLQKENQAEPVPGCAKRLRGNRLRGRMRSLAIAVPSHLATRLRKYTYKCTLTA